MHDKVRYQKSIGLTAEFIGEDRNDEETRKAVQKDDCQIVFGSPEPCLSSDRWKKMLSSKIYEKQWIYKEQSGYMPGSRTRF